jgi:hypothetical protein
MKRAELSRQMKSWKSSELRELLVRIFLDKQCRQDVIIEAILTNASDDIINGALDKMGDYSND